MNTLTISIERLRFMSDVAFPDKPGSSTGTFFFLEKKKAKKSRNSHAALLSAPTTEFRLPTRHVEGFDLEGLGVG